MKVLVTGGAGYLGSITSKALEQAGHTPVLLDSLLVGPRQFTEGRSFYEGDVADRALVSRVVEEHPEIEATIHMAARIVVPESVELPYQYYRDNVVKSLELFDQLQSLASRGSSSPRGRRSMRCSRPSQVRETDPVDPTSPYARTRRILEMCLEDISKATSLRRSSCATSTRSAPTRTSRR